MIRYLLFVSFAFVWIQLSAQTKYESGKHMYKGDAINYRILYPENFDASKKYPVVFFLHGAGERGDDNKKQLVHGSKLFLDSEFRENYPAVVIFPQCPKDDYWSNVKSDRSAKPITRKFSKKGKPTVSMTKVLSLMDSIVALDYSLDNQVYIGGLSMGGMGTFEVLARRPQMFAAAFAICGGGHPKTAERYAEKTSIWVFHGGKDDVVLPQYSTAMVLALQESGGEVRFNLYPNANHNSWDPAFAEKELLPWLFSHKRK